MDHADREFFLYKILRGVVNYKDIIILPPTKTVYYDSCELYFEKVIEYINCGVMTQEELNNWMFESGYWSKGDDDEIERFRVLIEDTKVNAYEKRADKRSLIMAKNMVKDIEYKIRDLFEIKTAFYRETCEYMANLDKTAYIITNSSFIKNTKKLYLYTENIITQVIPTYNEQNNFDEDVIRDLCRHDPWKTMWSIRNNVSKNWFSYPKREMTNAQKMLIAWSQTYDNVYESMESPTQDVINDDFLLDGWFIVQSRKKKTQSVQSDIDSGIKNEKIKSSTEIFKVVGNNVDEAKRVNKANTPYAQMLKKQKQAIIDRNGTINE